MVINVSGDDFTVILARCIHIRGVVIAPDIDKILEIAGENSRVPALLTGETLGLSIGMADVNLPVVRIQSCCLIINIARFIV